MNAAGPDAARFAHDASKTAKNLASRQGKTQKPQIAGHDAGETTQNLASWQEKGTGGREPGDDAGKTGKNLASWTIVQRSKTL